MFQAAATKRSLAEHPETGSGGQWGVAILLIVIMQSSCALLGYAAYYWLPAYLRLGSVSKGLGLALFMCAISTTLAAFGAALGAALGASEHGVASGGEERGGGRDEGRGGHKFSGVDGRGRVRPTRSSTRLRGGRGRVVSGQEGIQGVRLLEGGSGIEANPVLDWRVLKTVLLSWLGVVLAGFGMLNWGSGYLPAILLVPFCCLVRPLGCNPEGWNLVSGLNMRTRDKKLFARGQLFSALLIAAVFLAEVFYVTLWGSSILLAIGSKMYPAIYTSGYWVVYGICIPCCLVCSVIFCL